jgi:hypothetical protein
MVGGILHFYVLELIPRKAVLPRKILITPDLAILANQMLIPLLGFHFMRGQLLVETMVCSEYQRLLEESECALKTWSEHRSMLCRSRLVEKKAADELLLLQSRYARAYARLRRHAHNCLRCNCDLPITRFNSGAASDIYADGKPYF